MTTRATAAVLMLLLANGASAAGFERILRNPLADPYILGISSGASVGVLAGTALSAGGAIAAGFAVFAWIQAHTIRRGYAPRASG